MRNEGYERGPRNALQNHYRETTKTGPRTLERQARSYRFNRDAAANREGRLSHILIQ